MSLGVRHSMLLPALIQVASLGADQLSLGKTEPPSEAIVCPICVWMSGHACDGSSEESSEEEPGESESEENVSLEEAVSRGAWGGGVSGGRMMPSERR